MLEHLAHVRQSEAEQESSALAKLDMTDRIEYTREQRSLARFHSMQRYWNSFQSKMMTRLGKDLDELVITRGAAFREMREQYELLDKVLPANIKFGDKFWEMSLRGGGCTYVPVGNKLSGLYIPVENKPVDPNKVTTVRVTATQFGIKPTGKKFRKTRERKWHTSEAYARH